MGAMPMNGQSNGLPQTEQANNQGDHPYRVHCGCVDCKVKLKQLVVRYWLGATPTRGARCNPLREYLGRLSEKDGAE
jgi:hypothetical protein